MVAEKDWDKTVGTAADARRIFENVPAEFAVLAANIVPGTGGFVLAGPARLVDRICSETSELLLRPTGYNDDVTLLAAQRRTPTPPLHMAVDATIHAARAVRAGFVKWLLEIGADSADVSDVVHAISEFVESAGRRGVARRRWEPARGLLPR